MTRATPRDLVRASLAVTTVAISSVTLVALL